MKKLIFIILATATFESSGQAVTNGDWLIENEQAMFRKVFNKPGDSIKLLNGLKAHLQSKIALSGDSDGIEIRGNITRWVIDYKKLGKSGMSTPLVFRTGKWSGLYSVRFKNDRYLVEVWDINVDTDNTVMAVALGVPASPSTITLWNDIALNKARNKFRSGQQDNIEFLQIALVDLFTIAEREKKDF